MNFKSVDEVLDFAIEKEEESNSFYMDLAGKVEKPYMKKVFQDFAREELGHKAKLQSMKEGKRLIPSQKKVMDLKIADYLVDITPEPDIDYQQALILAMKKEKAAFKLYNELAGLAEDDELRSSFNALAQEEAKHKLRFEIEYDENVLIWD
jgi:rubrerythrin